MADRDVDTSAFEASVKRQFEKLGEDVFHVLVEAATETRNEAVRRTPVDTGRLRAAWQTRQERTTDGGWTEVRNDTTYAPHVEFGTRKMKAQPMLRPAVAKVLPLLTAKIGRLLK